MDVDITNCVCGSIYMVYGLSPYDEDYEFIVIYDDDQGDSTVSSLKKGNFWRHDAISLDRPGLELGIWCTHCGTACILPLSWTVCCNEISEFD